MARVRRARRRGVREEPAFTSLNLGTGSNLVDMGRTQCVPLLTVTEGTPVRFTEADPEAMGKVCGVPMAKLLGHSRAPTPTNEAQ